MPADVSVHTLLMVAVGALAACSIEAASDRKLFSRLPRGAQLPSGGERSTFYYFFCLFT